MTDLQFGSRRFWVFLVIASAWVVVALASTSSSTASFLLVVEGPQWIDGQGGVRRDYFLQNNGPASVSIGGIRAVTCGYTCLDAGPSVIESGARRRFAVRVSPERHSGRHEGDIRVFDSEKEILFEFAFEVFVPHRPRSVPAVLPLTPSFQMAEHFVFFSGGAIPKHLPTTSSIEGVRATAVDRDGQLVIEVKRDSSGGWTLGDPEQEILLRWPGTPYCLSIPIIDQRWALVSPDAVSLPSSIDEYPHVVQFWIGEIDSEVYLGGDSSGRIVESDDPKAPSRRETPRTINVRFDEPPNSDILHFSIRSPNLKGDRDAYVRLMVSS